MNFISRFFNLSIRDFFLSSYKEQTSGSKLDNLLFYISFFTSLMCVYVFCIQDSTFTLIVKKLIFVLIPSLMGLRILYTKRLNFWYLLLSGLIVLYWFNVKRLDVIGEFILLSWCIFLFSFKPTYKLSKRAIHAIGLAVCIIVGIHFYFYQSSNRASIGGLDPNYSGFLILLLIPMALFTRSILMHIVISILGIVTQSRGFLIAMIIYFSVFLLRKFYKRFELNFKHFFLITVILFIIVITCGSYVYTFGVASYGPPVPQGFERLFHLFRNQSDYLRWKSNVVFFQKLIKNFRFFLYGMDPLTYIRNVHLLPHNLPLLEIATHGVLVGSIFLGLFIGFIRRIYSSNYLPFYASLLIYWLLLGIEIGAVYNVFMINVMLLLREQEISHENAVESSPV